MVYELCFFLRSKSIKSLYLNDCLIISHKITNIVLVQFMVFIRISSLVTFIESLSKKLNRLAMISED